MTNVMWLIGSAVGGVFLVVFIMLIVFEVGWRIQTYHLREVTKMIKEAEKNGFNR